MKKIIIGILSMSFLLAACGKPATATPAPATTTPAPSSPPAQQPVTQTSAPATVTQAPDSPQPAPTNSPDCTDAAAFVADVTVPDATEFKPGDAFTKTWRIQNTGTCAWNNQYLLTFASGTQMGAPDSTPLSTTKPGATLDISVKMTAPSDVNTYRANFEIHNPSNAKMMIDDNTKVWVIIVVSKTAASSSSGAGTVSAGAQTSSPGGSPSSGTGGAGLLNSSCGFTTDAGRVSDVVAAINAYRAQNGIAAYTVNPKLTTAAQSHSQDMACNNLFVHTGTDGSTPTTRVTAAGYSASSVTENVYGSFPPLTGQGAVTWWATDQTDPNHNLNLISTKYKEIGVGYAFFNNFGYYVVDFAAP